LTRHHHATVEELRTSTRFGKDPDMAYAVVRHPEKKAIMAQVHEESLGGISLILEDRCDFDLGQEVEIAYLDSLLRAVVRHIEPRDDGTFLVGFECE